MATSNRRLHQRGDAVGDGHATYSTPKQAWDRCRQATGHGRHDMKRILPRCLNIHETRLGGDSGGMMPAAYHWELRSKECQRYTSDQMDEATQRGIREKSTTGPGAVCIGRLLSQGFPGSPIESVSPVRTNGWASTVGRLSQYSDASRGRQ